jgi:hypothetical protein
MILAILYSLVPLPTIADILFYVALKTIINKYT